MKRLLIALVLTVMVIIASGCISPGTDSGGGEGPSDQGGNTPLGEMMPDAGSNEPDVTPPQMPQDLF